MNRKSFIPILVVSLFIGGCGGGGSSSSVAPLATPTPPPAPATTTVNGISQQGPFEQGSTVKFFAVSVDGGVAASPSAEAVTDMLGAYEVSIDPGTYLITVEGEFFNEVTGVSSANPITLRSIVVVGDASPERGNTNVLTHLASDRILDLIANGTEPAAAIDQAAQELLVAFNPLLIVDQPKPFSELDLFKADEHPADAALLFLSSVALETSAQNAANGQPVEEAFTDFAIDLSEAFANPDTVADNPQFVAFMTAAQSFAVQGSIENLNALVNAPQQIPAGAVDSIVDSDLDGEVNSSDADDDNDGLNDEDEIAMGLNPFVRDSDGDGSSDLDDAFPLDAGESVDTDADGIGNVADADDDNDGVPDVGDTNPLTVDILVEDQFITLAEDTQVDVNVAALNTLQVVGSYSFDTLPAKGEILGDFPDLTYRPFENENGADNFVVVLASGDASVATIQVFITIDPVDDAPSSISQPASQSVAGFESVDIGPMFDNIDGLAITTAVENLPAWASVDSAQARIVGTPSNADVGTYADIRMTISNSGGSYTTEPLSITVAFEPVVDFDINLSNAEFTRTNEYLRAVVDGDSMLLLSEGTDSRNASRVMVQLFDPIAGEALWERMLDASHTSNSTLTAYADGFIVTSTDAGFNGVVTGLSREGDVLWTFAPTPFSVTTTAIPRDSAALVDGRIVVILAQSNPGQSGPYLHKHAFYHPATDTLTEVDFDSGVPDATRSQKIVADTDGGYWVIGGDIVVIPSVQSADAWARKYAADGTEMFTTLLSNRGDVESIALHPNGDLLLGGYTEAVGGWVARVDAGGVNQFISDIGSMSSLQDIAVQPNGSYSTLSQTAEYRFWSDGNQLIESRTFEPDNGDGGIEPHADYGVLSISNGHIRSVPLPP